MTGLCCERRLSTNLHGSRSHAFFGERLRAWGWVGIVVSCGGIALITLSQNTSFHLDLWALLVLMAALAQSLYSVGQKPLLTKRIAHQLAPGR